MSIAAAVALSFATPAAAALTPPEQAMIRTVDAEQERTVAMLEKWVNQNSGTMNFPGVKSVGDRHEGRRPRRAPSRPAQRQWAR